MASADNQGFSLLFLSVVLYITSVVLASPASVPKEILHSITFKHNYKNDTVLQSLDRRKLAGCMDPNPFISISHDVKGYLSDRQRVTVTVSGVIVPSELDWIAVVSPSTSSLDACLQDEALYLETGDIASLPLLCHYPIKFQFLTADPTYMNCSKKACSRHLGGFCVVSSCSASLTFEIINIRTDIKFVFFTGGFEAPCVLAQSSPISFSNPNQPLYGHLSAVDSSGTAMKLTWISANSKPQTVQYANGLSVTSSITTFHLTDMCSAIPNPASSIGWHDPGYIHSAIMTGLLPSTVYDYKYGSDRVGWSPVQTLKTPPASGASELTFITYGDMGKAPRDNSIEHYIQPGSISVINSICREVSMGNVDLVLHIGDISYATGFLAEWDYFLDLINPIASVVPYMTAIGNHERDFPESGSYYSTSDSGGECGVAYEKYFPMPTLGKDKSWYSFESGPVHFAVMSTEHNWASGSEQYNWIIKDLASVDRNRTPWVIFSGHRPQYSSVSELTISTFLPSVDLEFRAAIEPLILKGQVDLVLWGHVHNYERTCAIYQGKCIQLPSKDGSGMDVYQMNPYRGPVHAIIGMAGFSLDSFAANPANWSLSRISEFGYTKVKANRNVLQFQFIQSAGGNVQDSFKLVH